MSDSDNSGKSSPAQEMADQSDRSAPATDGSAMIRPQVPATFAALYALQRDGSMCDVEIECAGGERIFAHRAALSAASGYFQSLPAPAEGQRCKAKMDNISMMIMSKIIAFLYTGDIDLDSDEALPMMRAARYLRIATLDARCSIPLAQNLSAGKAIILFEVANELNAPDLRSCALSFLEKNIESLMIKEASFLENVNPTLMRLLLESDHLVVSDEDSVFNFLMAWLDKNREKRTKYMGLLKELIRFPFLRVTTVERLVAEVGSIRGIPKAKDAAVWNLESRAFRRREYTNLHSHILWEQDRGGSGFCKLTLTCHLNNESEGSHLWDAPVRLPRLDQLTACGHKLYFLVHETEAEFLETPVLSFDFLTILHSLNPRKHHVYSNRVEYYRDPGTRYTVHATRYGDVRLFAHSQDISSNKFLPRIFLLNSSGLHFDHPITLNERAAVNIQLFDKPVIRDRINLSIIDLASRQWAQFDEPAPKGLRNRYQPSDDQRYLDVIQRGTILFLFLFSPGHSTPSVVRTYDLVFRRWGRAFKITASHVTEESQLQMIQGKICIVSKSTVGSVFIDRLDDDSGNFVPVRISPLENSRFVGTAPTDLGPPCQHETWLDSQCRQLSDDTQCQRATIHRLRQFSL